MIGRLSPQRVNFRDAILWLSIFNSVIKVCITDWDCVWGIWRKREGWHCPASTSPGDNVTQNRVRVFSGVPESYGHLVPNKRHIHHFTFLSLFFCIFLFSQVTLISSYSLSILPITFCLTCSPFFFFESIYSKTVCMCVCIILYVYV